MRRKTTRVVREGGRRGDQDSPQGPGGVKLQLLKKHAEQGLLSALLDGVRRLFLEERKQEAVGGCLRKSIEQRAEWDGEGRTEEKTCSAQKSFVRVLGVAGSSVFLGGKQKLLQQLSEVFELRKKTQRRQTRGGKSPHLQNSRTASNSASAHSRSILSSRRPSQTCLCV